jgi:hypothetical protein
MQADADRERAGPRATRDRRTVLKLVGTGAVGLAALEGLPRRWTRPIVESVVIPAHAQGSFSPINFASATLGATGQTGGVVLADYQYLGVRFTLAAAGRTTAIGIHASGTGNIFGAVVKLTSLSDYPDSYDLSTPDVQGHVVMALSPTSSEIQAPLAINLLAGVYALIFGAGPFGTTGSGASPQNDTDILSPSYYFGSGGPPVNQWNSGGFSRVRMFLI